MGDVSIIEIIGMIGGIIVGFFVAYGIIAD